MSDALWWQRPFRLFQTNIREVDAALDVDTATDYIVESGYDVWLLNAGGIAYFYPTDAPHQQPAVALGDRADGDLIGAAVAAGAARGITVVGRFDFSRLPSDVVEAHPDWAYRRADGNWQEDEGLISLCPTSEYHREIAPRILRDFVVRYDVGGVFFNWLNFPEVSYTGEYGGPCHCPRCLQRFADETGGIEHPTGPADEGYAAWVASSRRVIQALADEYQAVVTAARPGAAVFLADAHLDLEFLEINSFLGAAETGKWWAHTPSEMVSIQRLRDPDVRAIVHASSNLGLAYRMIDEEPAQFRRYFAQALSRGGDPGAVVIGPPDPERMPSLAGAAEILAVHRDNSELYGGMRLSSTVGLVRPVAGTALAAMQSSARFEGYRGFFTALQERHVPFDVVGADSISAALLAQFEVVIVPDGVALDEKTATALGAWVKSGGRLVRAGAPSDTADRFDGAELAGRYVTTATPGVRWPAVGTFWRTNVPDGAEAALWLTSRAPFGPPEKAYGWEPLTDWPGLVRASSGAGRVVTFPWTAGESAWRSGLTSLGDVLADEVIALRGQSAVTATLPRAVELTVADVTDGILIHLVDHGGSRADRAREGGPVAGIVHLAVQPSAVRSLRGHVVEVRPRPDGGADLAIGPFDLWEALHVVV